MMRDLIAHKGYANALMLEGIRAHPDAARDPSLLELLHHILVSNRFWMRTCSGLPFDLEQEMIRPDTIEGLIEKYESTQREENVWIAQATEEELARSPMTDFILWLANPRGGQP